MNTVHTEKSTIVAYCGFTGAQYAMQVPFAVPANAGTNTCTSPLLEAALCRTVVAALPSYWLAMRALWKLRKLGMLRWSVPLPESAAGAAQWSLLAEWAARCSTDAANAKPGTAMRALAFSLTPHTVAPVEALVRFCCDAVSVHVYGTPGLLEPLRGADRAARVHAEFAGMRASQEADLAERAEAVARKRAAVRTLEEALHTVCEILEDLPAAEWSEHASAVLKNTTSKNVTFAKSTLLRMRAAILDYFPQATFVGERAALCAELALQHLDTVALEQAARLRKAAIFEEDLAEAVELEQAATERALSSPAGRFSTLAASSVGAAPKVAVKLNSALAVLNARSSDPLAEVRTQNEAVALARASAALKHLVLRAPKSTGN